MSLIAIRSDGPTRILPDGGRPVTVTSLGASPVFFGTEQGVSSAVKTGEVTQNNSTTVTQPTYFLVEPPARVGTNVLGAREQIVEVTQTGTQLDRIPPESISGVDVPGSFLGKRLVYAGQIAIKDSVAEVKPENALLPLPVGGEGKALTTKKIKVKPTEPFDLFRYESADYEITGRTAKLQVVVDSITNATNPNITFAVQVLPLDKIETGAGKELEYAFLTTVAEASVVANAAKTAKTTAGTAVALPASNLFTVGVSSNGTTAAESNTTLSIRVYVTYS